MITVVFGNPGCGKTTDAIKRAIKSQKKYDHAYVNFEHTYDHAYLADLSDLGDWTFKPNSLILIDEAGIEYNNRAFKALPKKTIAWFKKHRHYRCDCIVYSQSFDDMDVTLRRLAVEYWLLYRIGPWTLSRRIYKKVGIDKQTSQIIDKYQFASLLWLLVWPLQYVMRDFKYRLTYRPRYYKYFDSWATDDLRVKEFPLPESPTADE